ncbi:translocation/assembly module TamB domain-containing protein [Botryobacter ruber]|uniref:translocation/assembly module TamB domain-containing protein n=1 Tax=Botryobacter ruber TaxID=2171629 RepID=UPI000F6539C6|nr:translocation/assembly module TamB [Botryobacter ruber]
MGLLLLIVIALQVPGVQNFVAQKTANYLEDSWGTRVDIGSFTTDWRNAVVLNNVYIEDQQQDTLWYSERLGLDMKVLSLLKGELNIGRIDLQNATAKLHIRPDSSANYDFILDAFATDTTAAQPADTTAAAMKINLDVINIENFYLDYRDEAAGNLIRGRVGQLVTTMEELNLEEEIYRIDEVNLKNTGIRFVQTKLPPETEPQPITMQFGLNRVELENIDLNYVGVPSDQRIVLDLGKAELTADNIDLPNARVDLGRFDLHNTSVVYAQEKYVSPDSLTVNPAEVVEELDKSVEKTQGQPIKWVIGLDKINVSDVHFAFDNYNVPEQKQGMDFDHLLFRNIELDADNFRYSMNQMGIELNQLKLTEQSGFAIQNFNADIEIDSTRASLTNLDLRTNNSKLGPELELRYPSYTALAENPEQIAFAVNLQENRLAMEDVLYFVPDLANDPSFRKIAGSTLYIEGRAAGEADNFRIERLEVIGLQNTRINVSGNVRNATNPDNLYLDLRIRQLNTTRTDILALTPPGVLPPNIRIPSTISMTGTYQGSLTAFDTDLDIRSSVGNITAKVDMDQGPKGAEPFKATVNVQKLNMRELFTDSLGLGTVTMQATATGTGLTPETMRAKVQAQVQELGYNNYTYNNIDVNATINQNLYTVNATSADENIAFTLNGDFNLRDSQQPSYTFNLDLKEANLQTLNFYPEPLSIQGNLQGRFTGADASTLSGTLNAQELVISHNQKRYPVDSLWMNLKQTGEVAEVQLRSTIADATMQFENTLATLPTALQKHFSNYFDLQPDPPYPANVNLGDFRINANLKNPDLISSFVPGLTQLSVADTIVAAYNGDTQQLTADVKVSSLTYTGYTLKNLDLQVRGNREQLGYNVNLRQLSSPSLKLDNVTLTGAARDNDLTVRLAVGDSTAAEQFVLGGLLNSMGRGYRFTFNPDQLVINSDKWTVPQNNYLQFDTNLLYANNIRIERGNSYISMNSTGPVTPNAPLQVQFGNFDIAYLMQTFQQQDSLIAGVVNGTATLNNIMSGAPTFTSDLTVSDFAYMGVPVGNIALEASSSGNNRYNLNATLTGNGNQMLISGFYEMQPDAGLLNLDANISTLNIASLQGFTQGIVEDLDGSASGKLRITGTLDSPRILGDLNFNQAQFNISMLNSIYRLQNERMVFNEQGISLNDFTLTDTLGNNLEVNGNILTQNYVDYRFDLTANTDNFLAMNSTSADNDLFYGTVKIAADATITGTMAQPEIDVTARVLDGSTFTAVIPAENVGAAEREGIVEFVDLNPALTAIVGELQKADTTQTGFIGADVEAEITVTDATTITIVIDPITGDHLEVRGSATPLLVGMTPSGTINMTGRYEISDGVYRMDFFDLASRELQIAEGSYISWAGDPMQGDMQITAIYNVQAAPMELIASQAAASADDPALRNRLPFQLYVNVEGDILTPEITFDIQLPEEERGAVGGLVDSSLGNLRQDEAEMNKQVFSLLVLGRFMAPDPFTSSGSSFAATARNSLSQVMTDQLNQLTQRYAGGLGIEFGINSYEDYSSGAAEGRTDLNVALRQQFLDNRLSIRVGSDIGLEGQQEANRNASGFTGDISVEYSLTKDGRLRVRVFQRDQYEFLEGDVRATGAALVFAKEYNNFSDLFRSLERRKEKNVERRMETASQN